MDSPKDHPVDLAIEEIVQDFQHTPHRYFTEEDVRWRLMERIESHLTREGGADLPLDGGVTAIVHGEYPTPFRCSMKRRQFSMCRRESTARRGHYDIVLLNRETVAQCDFEVARSQYYRLWLEELPNIHLPFLDHVIELKLYRDLAHSNRTESPWQQAQYAAQAIQKVAAALDGQDGYYRRPFARRGVVLLLDNSDLVARGDLAGARTRFCKELDESVAWRSLPETLSILWATPTKRRNCSGRRPPHILDRAG